MIFTFFNHIYFAVFQGSVFTILLLSSIAKKLLYKMIHLLYRSIASIKAGIKSGIKSTMMSLDFKLQAKIAKIKLIYILVYIIKLHNNKTSKILGLFEIIFIFQWFLFLSLI